jgi:hypothetical protein
MRLPTLLLALALFVPTADAAVIATTKAKDLPVIANLRAGEDLVGFSFDIERMPPVSKYDVWVGLSNERGKVVGQWYAGSIAARRGKRAPDRASFGTDLGDLLRYRDAGTYVLTAYACAPNLKRPNGTGCARASVAVEHGE